MAPGKLLMRNIQPVAREDEYVTDEDLVSEDEASGQDSSADLAGNGDQPLSEDEESEEQASEAGEGDSKGEVHEKLNVVSFGALKQAHESLSKKRKRHEDSNEDKEAKLAALRERLHSMRKGKQTLTSQKHGFEPEMDKSRANRMGRPSDGYSDADSSAGGSDEEFSKRGKHAPREQSSKYQVTRRRQVIPIAKQTSRDPRFDALRQRTNNTANEERAYAFLQDYQKDEVQQLRAAMKLAKSQDEKDVLRRQINAMENRLHAKAAKEREQQIKRQHRKEEGEQIRQGKNPYYLKQSEIKERALVEKFESMKGKDREKLMERRRKKASQKEKKRMPDNRRAMG